MTYDETVNYLYNCAPPFQQVGGAAYKGGLANSIALDNHLGNPHRRFRIIHVAGTNGKGSVSTFTASVLKNAGYKVGRYVSPTIFTYRERFQINDRMISKKELGELMEQVKEACDKLVAEGHPHPTSFEIETALAFLYFVKKFCF